MARTETLEIEWDKGVISNGFHTLLWSWWDLMPLKGKGFVIGFKHPKTVGMKRMFLSKYPDITEVFAVDLEESDINWDITTPLVSDIKEVDWIICQAVMEHVVDPVAAIRNMAKVLNKEGMLYIHTHGPAFGFHRWPLDCYRFHRDALVGWAQVVGLEIIDLLWSPHHCYVAYRK
jgi:SAM-dependent methyltransferase